MNQKTAWESNLLTPNKGPFCRTIERNMALTTVKELVQEDGNFHFSKADIPFVDRCLGLIELSQSQRHLHRGHHLRHWPTLLRKMKPWLVQ